MDKVRFGILGCGGMAHGHARRLRDNAAAELVALCDLSDEITGAFAEWMEGEQMQRPATFTDAARMYEDADLDAVMIVTPHTLHFAHGMQALAAGCDVFMEKPMVTNSQQAYELAAKVEETGKVMAVGYNTPCTPAFQYLRAQIRAGTLGRLELVSGYLSQSWLKGTRGTWRQDPAMSGGGQAYDSGAHILNSLVWSVEAQVAQVFTFMDNCGSPVDINSTIAVKFANGVLAGLCIGGNCPSSGSHMAFIFDGGRVDIDGWAGSWIKVYKGKEEIEPELPQGSGHAVDNFIDAVRGKAGSATSPLNGIHHSELMDAIYESASSGGVASVRAGQDT